jgi:hypothetical protein
MASLSAVFASSCFSLAYAHAAQRAVWPISLLVGLISWVAAVSVLALLPPLVALDLSISIVTLALAPLLFPVVALSISSREIMKTEVAFRMLTGAILTVAVTAAAGTVGQT